MGTPCDSPSWPRPSNHPSPGPTCEQRELLVISASDLKLDLALLPGEALAPKSKEGIPTMAVQVRNPQNPQHNQVMLCLVWVGYAAIDEQRGCQAWLQTFTPVCHLPGTPPWKPTWLSSSPPSGLCTNAHHYPHLTPQPCTPHSLVLGFFDFIELITTWHFPLSVCSD